MLKVGVLSVQGAVTEHLNHLRKCNVKAVAVKDQVALEEVSGLIIPGGESTTIGKLITAFGLSDVIKERTRQKKLALFGTCAGMVLMASKVIDGIAGQSKLELMDISVKRNAFGRQRESFETELKFSKFDPPLTAVFIRAPIILEARPSVEVLATLPEGIVAARQENMLAASFHPELTDDLRVHQYFVEMCRKTL